MRRLQAIPALLSILVALALPAGPPSSAEPTCRCAEARLSNGWCEAHAVGYVAGVAVENAFLFEALDAHGHDVDPTSFTCPDCQEAIETDGFCAVHRIGFVDGQAYFSKLTYLLARAKIRRPAELQCPACRLNSEGHGWCETCRVGQAGAFTITNRQDFEELERELRRLRAASAIARRCQYCGVAAWVDSSCPLCKIAYREGRALAPE